MNRTGKKALRLNDYLGHIEEAINKIQSYVSGMDQVKFSGDGKTQDAVYRNFEVIGEASRNINESFPEFVKQHPEMAFADAYKQRNKIAHGYFEVDSDAIWNTTVEDLPVLKQQIRDVMKELEPVEVGHSPSRRAPPPKGQGGGLGDE
jgi:uncharacterized protein with HEPN domain